MERGSQEESNSVPVNQSLWSLLAVQPKELILSVCVKLCIGSKAIVT